MLLRERKKNWHLITTTTTTTPIQCDRFLCLVRAAHKWQLCISSQMKSISISPRPSVLQFERIAWRYRKQNSGSFENLRFHLTVKKKRILSFSCLFASDKFSQVVYTLVLKMKFGPWAAPTTWTFDARPFRSTIHFTYIFGHAFFLMLNNNNRNEPQTQTEYLICPRYVNVTI